MENNKLSDNIKLFERVYYCRKDLSYSKKMPQNRKTKDVMILVMKKLIQNFQLDFSYFSIQNSRSTSLGIGFYQHYEKEKIPYVNLTFNALKNLYNILYDICFKQKCPDTIRLNKFDLVLYENKKLITDYIFFLRFFPYFNYFMLQKTDEYTNLVDDEIEDFDIIFNPTEIYSFMDKLDNKTTFYYLENIRNILTGNLNLFDYYFNPEFIGLREDEITIMSTFQRLLEEGLVDTDQLIDQDIYKRFIENTDDNEIKINFANKWLLNKYLIYYIKTFIMRPNVDNTIDTKILSKLDNLQNNINAIERIRQEGPFEIRQELYDRIGRIIKFVVNLLILILQSKDREDLCLILTLLFSNKNKKIICNTKNSKKNYLFNTIKNFEEDKNIEIYIS